MPSEMVDRVARALNPSAFDGTLMTDSPAWAQSSARQMARTAIEAMREPTQVMTGTIYLNGDTISASALWRDMIDLALRDRTSP